MPDDIGPSFSQQIDYGQMSGLVSTHFSVEESLLEENVPTFYLKQPQETKQSFLNLLRDLGPLNLIAFLRWRDGRIVLKVVPKPPVKRSNILVNWLLFFATIGTTFLTGYILSQGFVTSDDTVGSLIGGAVFSAAIMAVLGMHEMGHKLIAGKRGINATPPYFIPGPPPIGDLLGIGTFGAVIMQKSLPPNRDALFDVGASGPILGFVLAVPISIVGLLFSSIHEITKPMGFLPSPLIFDLFAEFVVKLPEGYYILLHPVAFAGWVGILVTMLNLMPAAMLDGGHVARSLVGERTRLVLTGLSIVLLIVAGFLPMALFVLFIAMNKHPGPLDDVSGLSTSRKLMAAGLAVVFVLCSYFHYFFFALLRLLGL